MWEDRISWEAFAVLAALPLGAAELTHRWSFNGDYSDSVGGVDAVKCGTYVSLYGGSGLKGQSGLKGRSLLIQ